MIKKFKIVFLLFLAFPFRHSMCQSVPANSVAARKEIGGVLEIYPAGIITEISYENSVNARTFMSVRLGVNFADRKDYSPYNDNEKGKGFGAGFGLKRHFQKRSGYFFTGINVEFWNMWINWQNEIGKPNETNGQTYTFVIQPWLEGGYSRELKLSPVRLGSSLGFGREINIITNGKEVGQGWMLSWLFNIHYTLK